MVVGRSTWCYPRRQRQAEGDGGRPCILVTHRQPPERERAQPGPFLTSEPPLFRKTGAVDRFAILVDAGYLLGAGARSSHVILTFGPRGGPRKAGRRPDPRGRGADAVCPCFDCFGATVP